MGDDLPNGSGVTPGAPQHSRPSGRPGAQPSGHPGAVRDRRAARGTLVLAGVADVLCIVIFVLIGRRSHDEASALAGMARTAWPFLAGLVIAWAAARAWRGPLRFWPTAVLIWAVTVAAGLALRIVSGQGASGAFPLVAAGFLAFVLLGWRLVARLAMRRRP